MMKGRKSPKWLVVAWGVLWIVFLTLPLAYLLGGSNIPLAGEWLGGLEKAFAGLFGERLGRWIFGGLWFALSAGLCWRLVFSKKRFDLGDPADLHD
jgi:hypothetical protein